MEIDRSASGFRITTRPRACSTSSRRRSGRFPILGPTPSTRSFARSFSKRPRHTRVQGKSNVGGWRSRNDLFHWPVPEVKEIGAWIMDCVRQVVEATARPDRFRGTLSAVGWASVCRTGNYNAPHIHPESAWSGVYYVDAGDPDDTIPLSGCLELLDPRPAAGGVNTPGDPFGHPVRIAPRGRPARPLPELADALGPPAFRPAGTDRHLVQRLCHPRK